MEFQHSTLEKKRNFFISDFPYKIQILRFQRLFGGNTLEFFLVSRILTLSFCFMVS